jgi:hypothetical protein
MVDVSVFTQEGQFGTAWATTSEGPESVKCMEIDFAYFWIGK